MKNEAVQYFFGNDWRYKFPPKKRLFGYKVVAPSCMLVNKPCKYSSILLYLRGIHPMLIPHVQGMVNSRGIEDCLAGEPMPQGSSTTEPVTPGLPNAPLALANPSYYLPVIYMINNYIYQLHTG